MVKVLDQIKQTRCWKRLDQFNLDKLTLIIFALFLLANLFNLTPLSTRETPFYNQVVEIFLKLVRYFTYVFFTFLFVIHFINQKYKNWLLISTLFIFILSFLYSKNTQLIITVTIILAVSPVVSDKFRDFLKVYIIAHSTVLLIIPFLSFIKIIPNINIQEFLNFSAALPKYTLGFSVPGTALSLLFFLILEKSWLSKGKFRYGELITFFLLILLVSMFSGTFLPFLIILIYFILILLLKVRPGIFSDPSPADFKKFIFLLPYIFTFIWLIMGMLYNPENSIWFFLNRLFTDRISTINKGLQTFPLSLFGSPVNWNGYDLRGNSNFEYTLIDCSYINCLINFGIIPTLLILSGLSSTAKRLLRSQNPIYIIIFIFILIYSSIELHLFSLTFNSFLLLIGIPLTKKEWSQKDA